MLLDIAIICIIASIVYRNRASGLSRQALASIGFFSGLLIGRLLKPYTLRFAHTIDARASVAIVTLLGIALVGLFIGEYAGVRLKHHLHGKKLNRVDNIAGSVLTCVSLVLCVWLLAAASPKLSDEGLQQLVNQSYIISGLNSVLPAAPTIISDISNLIDPNGFPDVFIGNEPIPRTNVDLPALGVMASAVSADRDSVVRLEGRGCGGVVSGSGFVIAPGLVATNAHVVAGTSKAYVQDVNGTHKGMVVAFDPKLDFAILRVPDLAGKPLALDATIAKTGTPAAVLGYPGGGNFKADPAAVLSQIRASGHDIYGGGQTIRDIYELKASVIPGNSGGPVIGKDGRVIGVVFAESTTYNHVGYAIISSKIVDYIAKAQNQKSQVNIGHCAN